MFPEIGVGEREEEGRGLSRLNLMIAWTTSSWHSVITVAAISLSTAAVAWPCTQADVSISEVVVDDKEDVWSFSDVRPLEVLKARVPASVSSS